ncbi:hypothetical protein ABB37_06425 [Leptomonas pyrrhocoris]|uniref:Uncharacterized protein n=1 Tax=Leptomonas pyrrhocoris TaxID=157538 RepID=A0A0N0VEM8_LEPPY|nr:hypothetical protein ABB37_06425 [Leptomonas pyrrhocoris]KPA78282.1 hypothetical protein ABB37_06425 [Leptomonas pyrrhocoris]|eukprot:XP_015656721.1 hypothetical protein ABB37_06425 [Leptomonas pyrrhocoris]
MMYSKSLHWLGVPHVSCDLVVVFLSFFVSSLNMYVGSVYSITIFLFFSLLSCCFEGMGVRVRVAPDFSQPLLLFPPLPEPSYIATPLRA